MLYYPRSVFRLTLIALLLVALPLIAALVGMLVSVERQADLGQRAVMEAIQAARAGRAVMQRLGLVQRQAQRFVVVGGDNLLTLYTEANRELTDVLNRLNGLLGAGPAGSVLARLEQDVATMFERVGAHRVGDPNPIDPALEEAIFRLGKELVQTLEQRAETRLEEMESAANRAGRRWLWWILLLVPVSALLAFVATLMIVRPIRRMEVAIRDLGDGRFDQEIRILGPSDVSRLGARLDWLRRRLRELEQEKVRFLSHVSHELKTPLTAVREGAELLADQALGPVPDDQREVVGIMRENALTLQGLIESLVNFNVATIRNASERHHPIAMDHLIAGVVDAHRPMLHKKRLRVTQEVQAVELAGDEPALRTLVDNLLSNAVKFSPAGGEVLIRVGAIDGRVVLDVADQGPGIHPGDRKRVFEAFYQGRPPAGEPVPGTGLGLSIAVEHAKAHGGELTIVDSDQGARLRAIFPLHRDPATDQRAPVTHP